MGAREKSFWAWGYADRFPTDDLRAGFAAHVAGLLGVAPQSPMPLPSIDAVAIPESRVAIPAPLTHLATADRVERITHTYGRSYRDLVRGFRGDFAAAPDVVAHPETEADVIAIVKWCSDEDLALVPYGGGSSVVGSVEVAPDARRRGVVSLALQRLDRVLEIDSKSRAIRVQAGALGPVLEDQIRPHGLSLRHFPQSFEHSTVGGWIATRAGGHFATLYTHIDDLVESLRVVTPAGTIETRRLPASGAGPSPDRLFLGSEGAFGVITEAWLRAHPRPRFRGRAIVLFDDFSRAVDATRAIAQAALYPANCRLLDAREASLNHVTDDGANVLILAFESADAMPETATRRAVAIAEAHGGRCPRGVSLKEAVARTTRDDEGDKWRAAFLDGPYLQSVLVSVGVVADTFETACTWSDFDRLHATVSDRVHAAMKRVAGRGSLSCRFTHVYPDGPAPYFTFLAPARVGEELDQWREIKQAACDALFECGATITHHHAVGRTHADGYAREVPSLVRASLGAVKATLDPRGVMNPGVLGLG
jgi:alkyldihydroxyacetonephosphate synthase